MPTNKPGPQEFLPLTTCIKGCFPFSVACPSFIYRAGYVENVHLLAPFVDEIQLLFFESAPTSLPSETLINELADLGQEMAVGYQVHLPSDLFLGHPDPKERQRASAVVKKLIKLCAPLNPSTFTLHLEPNPATVPALPRDTWVAYLVEIIQASIPDMVDRRQIGIENIGYPFEQTAAVLEAADLSVCMDMGHLLVQGVNLDDFYQRWQERIRSIHLHGVRNGRDHLPLDQMGGDGMAQVMAILKGFSGPVCLEIYSQDGLETSLAYMLSHRPQLNDYRR